MRIFFAWCEQGKLKNMVPLLEVQEVTKAMKLITSSNKVRRTPTTFYAIFVKEGSASWLRNGIFLFARRVSVVES